MLLYTSRVTIVAVFAAAQLLQLAPGGVSQEPAGPVWAGLSVDELFAEYGAIFGPNGNRNAASHLWSTFVLERAWQLPEAFVLELFRAFCPVWPHERALSLAAACIRIRNLHMQKVHSLLDMNSGPSRPTTAQP